MPCPITKAETVLTDNGHNSFICDTWHALVYNCCTFVHQFLIISRERRCAKNTWLHQMNIIPIPPHSCEIAYMTIIHTKPEYASSIWSPHQTYLIFWNLFKIRLLDLLHPTTILRGTAQKGGWRKIEHTCRVMCSIFLRPVFCVVLHDVLHHVPTGLSRNPSATTIICQAPVLSERLQT